MYFPLKVKKTIQAIGVVFREDNVARMNYMRLLKLLYISDRDSYREIGRPITGGSVIAMSRGPVLEEVYQLIRGQHNEMSLWDDFLRRDRYDLELIRHPDVDELSRFEITKLQAAVREHKDKDEWDLPFFTHNFQEWKKNNPGQSVRAIPLHDILEAVGQSAAAESIEKEAQEMSVFEHLLV